MLDKEPVYVIIPVHNRKSITLSCLDNLKKSGDLERYYLIVVDDGSTDGTTEAIKDLYPKVIILPGDGNLWWTGAIKKGMEYAFDKGAEFIVWLNDDCQFSEGAIAKLVNCSQNNQGAIAGCQGFELNQPTQLAFGGKIKTWKGYKFINAPSGAIVPCDLLSGNLVCIPRAVITQIGYPTPDVTPHYGGDSLYLIRAKQAEFSLLVDARSTVFNHPGEPRLYPTSWLLTEGEPLKIIKLVFVPQSGLSWRVWWNLNYQAYSYWGIFMFLKKYLFILAITIIRFLPISFRMSLFKKTT
ncbi:glycosyltransferase family 2 protein [Synechocystis sp. PCC 7509]|uniref:glycosyltransferase family 2 protein n=1 Tax=Synechocystis sp. PCC 7509 TaxID=927677 RepID=UPI0002ABB00A|nr:glycosyltransferase family 2 protein [Synechocystis sp. PCC 7509]